jgi:hypothetical protein
MSNIYVVNDYNIEVVTKFKNGTRVKFTVPYATFKKTITNDYNMRLDLWMETDNDKPYTNMYKLINLILDPFNGRIKKVEITPEYDNEVESD